MYIHVVDHCIMYTTHTHRYHSKASRDAQRNQNLTLVLAFMTDIEHLPITDISKSGQYTQSQLLYFFRVNVWVHLL